MTAGWRSGVAPNNFGYRFNHVAETFNARYPGNPSLFGQLWWQRILSRTLYMHLPLPKHCMFDSMNQSFLFSFEEASPFVQPHELYFFRVSYRLHLRNAYLVDPSVSKKWSWCYILFFSEIFTMRNRWFDDDQETSCAEGPADILLSSRSGYVSG